MSACHGSLNIPFRGGGRGRGREGKGEGGEGGGRGRGEGGEGGEEKFQVTPFDGKQNKLRLDGSLGVEKMIVSSGFNQKDISFFPFAQVCQNVSSRFSPIKV